MQEKTEHIYIVHVLLAHHWCQIISCSNNTTIWLRVCRTPIVSPATLKEFFFYISVIFVTLDRNRFGTESHSTTGHAWIKAINKRKTKTSLYSILWSDFVCVCGCVACVCLTNGRPFPVDTTSHSHGFFSIVISLIKMILFTGTQLAPAIFH